MIKKLQLVALGVVVLQAVGLGAMEGQATDSPRNWLFSTELAKRVTVKHPVGIDKEKHAKRQCLNLSVPRYVLEGKLDWHAELKKNPNLAWLPI
jgi:hypothetical protein